MKKQKFNKKLSLNKETITNLDKIKGGGDKYTGICSGHATCGGATCVSCGICKFTDECPTED